jgi:ribosomal protein S18 acetylase RimI-like enzyme
MIFVATKRPGPAVEGCEQQGEGEGDDTEADEVVGCCTLILKVLDAALPPPFPTRQPARLYIGNLAVKNGFRRGGCGSALLHAAEKLGGLRACDAGRIHVAIKCSSCETCVMVGVKKSALHIAVRLHDYTGD